MIFVVGLAAYVLKRGSVDLYGDPLRLFGFVRAFVADGCWPERLPISCRVAGRPWRAQNAGRPWSVRRAEGGQRFELRSGDVWPKDAREGRRKERSELSDIVRQPFGQDIWVGFRLRIQQGPASSAKWVNFGQLHNTPDPGEPHVSQIFTHGFLGGDRYVMRVRGSTQNPITNSPAETIVFSDRSFERGRWYRFVLRFRLDPQGRGVFQAWRDGVLVANYRGPLGYVDRYGPYFKFGLYRWAAPGRETLVGFFNDVRLSDTRSGLTGD